MSDMGKACFLAGQMVAAHIRQYPVVGVVNITDDNVRLPSSAGQMDIAYVRSAGLQAETLLTDSEPDYMAEHSEIAGYCLTMPNPQFAQDNITEQAGTLVNNCKDAILQAAHLLLKHGALDDEDIGDLCD